MPPTKVSKTRDLQIDQTISATHANADPSLRPLIEINSAILSSAARCADTMVPIIATISEVQRGLSAINITNEFVFFFVDAAIRTAAATLTLAETEKLGGYVRYAMAEIRTASYCHHWPQDYEPTLVKSFTRDLGLALDEYIECDGNLDELLATMSLRVMGQLEFGSDAAHRSTISDVVSEAYKDFNIDEALKDFKRESGNLPPRPE